MHPDVLTVALLPPLASAGHPSPVLPTQIWSGLAVEMEPFASLAVSPCEPYLGLREQRGMRADAPLVVKRAVQTSALRMHR